MTDLPFELDEAELIEACAAALRSIELFSGRINRRAFSETAQAPDSRTPPQRSATVLDSTHALHPQLEAQALYDSRELLPEPGGANAADIEAISRAVERDARRFEPT